MTVELDQLEEKIRTTVGLALDVLNGVPAIARRSGGSRQRTRSSGSACAPWSPPRRNTRTI